MASTIFAQPRPVSNPHVLLRHTVATKVLSWHGTGCSVPFLPHIPDQMAVPHRLLFGSAYGRKSGVDSEVDLAHIGQPKAHVPDHQLQEPAIVFTQLLLYLLFSELYEHQVRPTGHSLLRLGSAIISLRISVRQQRYHSLTSGLSLITLSLRWYFPSHYFHSYDEQIGNYLSYINSGVLSRTINLEARSIARVLTRSCGKVVGQSG